VIEGEKTSSLKTLNHEKLPKLSVIIPTYNERDNVPILINRIHALLNKQDYEITIVDDDSPDKTWAVAEQISHNFRNVKVIKRPEKMGLSSAFLSGLNYAKGDLICLMDADLQHPPELLHGLLKEISMGADIAVASRYVHGGVIEEWPLHRRIISRCAILLAHIVFPKLRAVKDPISGYFVFKKEVINGVTMNPKGFKILLEILLKGDYEKVAEVPYAFKPRKYGKSKLSLKEVWNYLRHVYKLLKDTKEHLRFYKFCLVGLSGIIVNEGVLWFLTETIGIFYLISAIFSIELSIINNFVWNEIWTFKDRAKDFLFEASMKRFFKFNLIGVGGMILGLILLAFLTKFLKIHYLLSNLFSICIIVLWNYLASSNIVWSSPATSTK